MIWQHTPYLSVLLLTALACAILGVYVWRHRPSPGVGPCVASFVATACWNAGYAMELSSANYEAQLFWANVQYITVESLEKGRRFASFFRYGKGSRWCPSSRHRARRGTDLRAFSSSRMKPSSPSYCPSVLCRWGSRWKSSPMGCRRWSGCVARCGCRHPRPWHTRPVRRPPCPTGAGAGPPADDRAGRWPPRMSACGLLTSCCRSPPTASRHAASSTTRWP